MASQTPLFQQLTSLNTPLSGESRSPAIDKIQTGIRIARHHKSKWGDFIPNNELNNLLTRKNIFDVISSITSPLSRESEPELDALVDQIDSGDRRNPNNSRKRIFAILTMLDIPSSIVHFVREGIWDRHLPFEYQNSADDKQLRYTKDDESQGICPVQCFGNNDSMAYAFQSSQWEFMAPLFNFTGGKIHHHQIQYKMPLPFMEESPVPIHGGNSQVSRVVIHHSHHDLADGSHFAVKQLLQSTDENFEQETKALKLLREHNNPHLAELLGTYKYHESYYLIFRWAIDDLETFWQSHPSPFSVPNMSFWALQQCLGMAKGLQLIHGGHCSHSGGFTLRGRHGDIKPANILRYLPRPGSNDPELGVLKISDFGLTRFHQNHSYRRRYNHGPLATMTYRSPEGDLDHEITYLWDLWPLGCLYLEFLTWILQGWDEVVVFSKERKDEDQSHYPELREDKFFNMNAMKIFGASRKDSVRRRIDTLRNHPDCTGLIQDFLTLISEDLIRISAKNRAGCDLIVQKMEIMEKRCEDNQDYYTKRQKRFAQKPTHESDKPHKSTIVDSNSEYENRSGDVTRSSQKAGSDSEIVAEESSISKLAGQPEKSRRPHGLLYLLGFCFRGATRYQDADEE
ncbi:kinase-like protein [Xylaria digitata]|nr:kinase-like protein [Xylaria digitata]